VDRVALAQGSLTQVSRWIEIADAKAQVLLTVEIFLNGLLLLRIARLRDWYRVEAGALFWIAGALAVIAFVALFTAIFLALVVTYPRRRPPSKHRSMFFFEHVAEEELHKLKDQFQNLSEDEIVAELVDQIWNVSQVAKVKFDKVASSATAAYIGGFAAILFLAMVELIAPASSLFPPDVPTRESTVVPPRVYRCDVQTSTRLRPNWG